MFGNAGQCNYDFAKAGLISFSLCVAREMSKYGVTSNAIAPRARTRMTEGTFGNIPSGEGFDAWDPDNVAPWVVYLCTEQASHISGQCFIVTGGEVHLIEQHHAAGMIDKGGRWTVEELVDKSAELFGDRPTTFESRFPVSARQGS